MKDSVNGAGVTQVLKHRIVKIRQGIGDVGIDQQDMAERLAQLSGVEKFDNSRLSRIELGKELKFYEAIAILRALRALDPEGRGYDWLIGTDPLPLKQAKRGKGERKSTVVEPIVTKRPSRRDKSA